ncbi:MAG: hypothetical protein U0S50_16395 [Sphingopyxis sp.]|uniref:hypothetical protein n=1 Tax=Sphingopyxis sp. TaxID=1908224 RepID=UPI002AB8A5E7|nr:hypothetical protein [Sphingopyxis sp.]MDZ3833373.1 hypothetical protein [Sphingopyxis sp.]
MPRIFHGLFWGGLMVSIALAEANGLTATGITAALILFVPPAALVSAGPFNRRCTEQSGEV